MSFALAALFIVWFALSVVNQFKGGRIIHTMKRRDTLGILPNWGFFTAGAGRIDVYLLTRDRDQSGETTSWREVDIGKRMGKMRLLYPERRIRIAVLWARHWLVGRLKTRHEGAPDVKGSLPYQLLLRYIMTQEHDPTARQCQFLIAAQPKPDRSGPGLAAPDRSAPLRPLVLSSFHDIRHELPSSP